MDSADCACLRNSLVVPIILFLSPKLGKQIGAIDEDVIQAIATSFQDRDGDIWIF